MTSELSPGSPGSGCKENGGEVDHQTGGMTSKLSLEGNSADGMARMVLAAALANLPAFVYGASVGWMSPSVPQLRAGLAGAPEAAGEVTTGVTSLMAGALSLGAAAATPLFTLAADRLGRRPALIIMSLVFAMSWSIKLVSARPVALVAARAVAGVATGGVYLVIPIYVREISAEHIRGALGSVMMFAVNLGVLTAYWLGSVLSYRMHLAVYLGVALLHCALFAFMPETPAYSVKRGRYEAAARGVAWLHRLPSQDARVQDHVAGLRAAHDEARLLPGVSCARLLQDVSARRAVRLAFVTVSMETLSGCFVVIQYSSFIFYRASGAGGTEDAWRPEHLSLFVGAVQLVGSVLSIYAVERCGRKPVLLLSTLVIAACMGVLGTWFLLAARGLQGAAWLPPLAVCVCIFSYGAGLANVPFVIIAEIFTFQERAVLSGWVTGAAWLVSTAALSLFEPVAAELGDHTVYLTCAAVALAGLAHTVLLLPETKDKSIKQIRHDIDNRQLFACSNFIN